jgi:hypothetical protein
VYPEGTGATPGLPRFGVGEIAGGFAGVSGTSVERFADSALSGGVFEGSAGGRCRRSAIGLRAPHPEEIIPSTTRVAKNSCRSLQETRELRKVNREKKAISIESLSRGYRSNECFNGPLVS